MGLKTALALAVLPLLASAAKDSRTFAVMHFQGDGPLIESRMDPIVNPGTPSGHVHTVMGGNGFALSMNDTVAGNSTCTNTVLKNDGSNYWTPKLYFQSPKDKTNFTAVDMFYMNVYYFFEATDDDIKAFEPGFRMLSGNPFLRSPPSTGGKSILDPAEGPIQPVQFTCPRKSTSTPLYPVNSNGLTGGVGMQDPQNAGAGVGFPDQNCDGYASPLRADIHFPSCYNPAAGPDNYHNNTAWPTSKGASAAGRQNCPPGWVHTPHIFFEVYWNTPVFANDWTQGQGTQPFVLAQGDPTGYGLHGDFLSGWDVETLQTIIDTCNAGDSGMDKCPQIPGGLSTTKTCNVSPPPILANEVVTGSMTALPGCNPIQTGPAPASPNPSGCPDSGSSGSGPSSTPAQSALAPSGSSGTPAQSVPAPSGSSGSSGSGVASVPQQPAPTVSGGSSPPNSYQASSAPPVQPAPAPSNSEAAGDSATQPAPVPATSEAAPYSAAQPAPTSAGSDQPSSPEQQPSVSGPSESVVWATVWQTVEYTTLQTVAGSAPSQPAGYSPVQPAGYSSKTPGHHHHRHTHTRSARRTVSPSSYRSSETTQVAQGY